MDRYEAEAGKDQITRKPREAVWVLFWLALTAVTEFHGGWQQILTYVFNDYWSLNGEWTERRQEWEESSPCKRLDAGGPDHSSSNGEDESIHAACIAVRGQRAASRMTPAVVSFTATKTTEKKGGTEENSSFEVRNCLSLDLTHITNWEEQRKNMWASDHSSTSYLIQSVRVTHLAYSWGVGVGKERILNQLFYWSLKANRRCLGNWNVIIWLKVASKVMKLNQHVVHENATQWKEESLEHSWKQ